jgi:putative ABC transport system permease protein
MALLIAYNSTVINADEHSRENATIFAYGVSTARVTRDMMIEALLTGVLGTAVGLAAGYAVLRWVVEGMPATMPDVGTLVTLRPLTYVLAGLTGTIIVSLLTLKRLKTTDIPSTLRVVD